MSKQEFETDDQYEEWAEEKQHKKIREDYWGDDN